MGLPAACRDPGFEVLGRDAEPGAEFDGDQLAVVDRASDGPLGQLAGGRDLLDRQQTAPSVRASLLARGGVGLERGLRVVLEMLLLMATLSSESGAYQICRRRL